VEIGKTAVTREDERQFLGIAWADVSDGLWLKSNVDAEHSSRLRFDGLTPANAYCSLSRRSIVA
jgi:hypothetical protein